MLFQNIDDHPELSELVKASIWLQEQINRTFGWRITRERIHDEEEEPVVLELDEPHPE